MTIVVIKESGA